MKTAKIKCLYTEIWPIEKLVENPKNPNRHPEDQLRVLGHLIVAHGWRNPIVVSRRSGMVVKGHGRLAAARRAGLQEVPVELQEYSSEAEELADMIADNRIAELSERDELKVLDVLSTISTDGLPSLDAGYTEAEFVLLTERLEGQVERNRAASAPVFQYNIVFRDENQQQEWFAFIRRLKADFPSQPTTAAKLIAFIERQMKG